MMSRNVGGVNIDALGSRVNRVRILEQGYVEMRKGN